MKANRAGQFKVSTAQHGVKKGTQFSENAYSNYLWNMMLNSLEKFMIFYFKRIKVKRSRHYGCRN